jgi:hypothetical protein
MVISLNIPEVEEKLLVEQAAKLGQSVESYAVSLIKKGITNTNTFSEILAPFRAQVNSSGISDSELDSLFETARNEVYQAKQG